VTLGAPGRGGAGPKVLDMTPAPAQTLTDEELVAAFRRGCERAFAEIDRRYRDPLAGFAARMLRGTGLDAEDVVQDALIRAHAALRATDRPMALRAWLYMITRNRALDLLRARHPQAGELDEHRLSLVPTCDAAETAMRRDELARVVEEIGRLPERQRLALVQRELCGTSHADLAVQLDTTVQGCKSLLIRARTQLRASHAAA
jgi:RNA polymerase sigma factor (sigma-70 family)